MTTTTNAALRQLPSVSQLLDSPALAEPRALLGHESLARLARQALTEARRQIVQDAAAPHRSAWLESLVPRVVELAQQQTHSRLGPVLNATGVVLHTSLGRAPLSHKARAALLGASGGCNLEVDLLTGDRRPRGHQLQSLFQQLTGAEAALVVNNNAAATVLALAALASGREVLLSRGQLVEIGGSFRLPEIFAVSGALLREIGTTNVTRLSDYQAACTPGTAALLRVHSSNYRITGFSHTPPLPQLVTLARDQGIHCLDDIGSGCLVDTTTLGLPREPTFQDSLAAGADLVLGSGDKLLGGPQCGILLGRRPLIDRLANHPLARAFRVDKLTLAALQATLESYLLDQHWHDLPTLQLLKTPVESLRARAERLAQRWHTHLALEPSRQVTVELQSAPVGGGSLPVAELPTAVLRLHDQRLAPDQLASRLRLGPPRIFPRVATGDVLIDLRALLPEEDEPLATGIEQLWLTRPSQSPHDHPG
ncbi:MAG: L-seryl-tRNA(Sec) selenium transferase [Planctomycetaceae bacterium]